MSADADVRHLLERLARVEGRVRALVAARRAGDPAPDDPFRGLYLSPEAVERILARLGARGPVPTTPQGGSTPSPAPPTLPSLSATPSLASAAPRPDQGRLPTLARRFDLDDLDVELLLVALAPDVDSRFEQLYGYLNDDVTRRRASVELGLTLCGVPVADVSGRARLSAGSPLVDGGLLLVEDEDRAFLTRALRVPDRLVAYLLGDDRPDPALTAHIRGPTGLAGSSADEVSSTEAGATGPATTGAAPLARAVRQGVRLCYLRGDAACRSTAAAALRAAGLSVLDLDLSSPDHDVSTLAGALAREARLRGAGVVADVDDAPDRSAATRVLAALPVPTLLVGSAAWDPASTPAVPFVFDVPAPPEAERPALWLAHLDGQAEPGLDPARETAAFRLGPEQIARAARAAVVYARAAGRLVDAEALRAGARSQNTAGLERLTRRIVPAVGWSQLVLPPPALERLRELAARARHRERVLGEWAMRPGGGRGLGVTALFTGESGTGKTTAAEVVADELGLELFAVDLATIVDKYVGETEKNLDRIFTEAAGVNGVLLFDEADAIFGKRSAVSDAHDRYANIESAYLLQRMESFDGLAILATNLRANLDEAFTRRLDMVVDFPLPDVGLRRALWDVCLGQALPRGDDLDLDYCAATFELAGGDIRSAAVTAAYLAADADRPVCMAHLLAAAEREYRKLGRLRVSAEFGQPTDAVRLTAESTRA